MSAEPVRVPTAEWLRAAAAEPYRIAYSVRAKNWTVIDIRPDDEPQVAGPFPTRDMALARATDLNQGIR